MLHLKLIKQLAKPQALSLWLSEAVPALHPLHVLHTTCRRQVHSFQNIHCTALFHLL